MWNGEDWTTVEPPNPHLTIMDLDRYRAEMTAGGQFYRILVDRASEEDSPIRDFNYAGPTQEAFWERDGYRSWLLNNVLQGTERQEKARERAKTLLREYLDDEQRECFDKTGNFFVVGNKTKRRYLLGYNSFVYRDDGRVFCLERADYLVPQEDAMLARKLLLETAENIFFDMANVGMMNGSYQQWIAPNVEWEARSRGLSYITHPHMEAFE